MLKRGFKLVLCLFYIIIAVSCSSQRGSIKSEDSDFLLDDPDSNSEVFRVLLTSNEYTVVQKNNVGFIERVADSGGDEFFKQEVKQHDYINETREGTVTVWLYPDSGRLMQVRPKKLFFLKELDALAIEDIKRWSFKFPKKTITPTKFDVHYRVILRKTLSDEEVQKKLLENNESSM